MSEINEQIWVGSYGDSCNEAFLSERRITHILSCADEFPMSIRLPSYKVPIVDDIADEKTKERFLEGAAKINEWLSDNEKDERRIIVHCFAGMSRSVSVVITYFMVYKGWSFHIALNHLKLRRRQTKIHPDFIPILKEIELGTELKRALEAR
jgi:protein-tyrosine phosphatase